MGWGCGGRPEGPGLTYFVSRLPTPCSPVNSYRGLEVFRSIAGRMQSERASEDNGGQKVRRKMGEETRRSARSGRLDLETGKKLENWKTGNFVWRLAFGLWALMTSAGGHSHRSFSAGPATPSTAASDGNHNGTTENMHASAPALILSVSHGLPKGFARVSQGHWVIGS